jgi:replicative DNA helicase
MSKFSLAEQTNGIMAYSSEQQDAFWAKVMSKEVGVRIPTGFPELDKALGGGFSSGLHILIGSPGAGKTSYALQAADNMARRGHPVMFFSAEMRADDIKAKSYARQSLDTGQPMDANEILTLGGRKDGAAVAKQLSELYQPVGENIIIIPREKIDTPDAIEHIVDEFHEATGVTPVLFIDYLQQVAAKFPSGSDKQAVDSILAKIGDLGAKYDMTIILISSIGRSSYDKPLSLAACKDSGTIEYAADTIMALDYTDRAKGLDFCARHPNLPRKVTLKLLKNRFGCLGASVDFKFDAKYNNFTEIPRDGTNTADTAETTY